MDFARGEGNVVTMAESKGRICFVALHAYPALARHPEVVRIGGAETQQVLVARGLLRRGYEVSFVTLDHGQPDGITHDGIRVFKMCRWSDGIVGVRFIHPRWTTLWRAMRNANADAYYQRGASAETGQVAAWCNLRDRPLVFAVASDTDCDPKLPYLQRWRERVLYRYGLGKATAVVAQTQTQVRRLRDAFGIEASIVRSCGESVDGGCANDGTRPAAEPPIVLWIGRFSYEKQPELLLDLAEACPQLDFWIVGTANRDSAYAREITDRAEALANVKLHGPVPHAEMAGFYVQAAVVICTSKWEGFPNTFIEAWSHGRPTVSTVDPDDTIRTHDLGGVGRTVAELKVAIERILHPPENWQARAERAREYFLRNHTVTQAVDAYESVLAPLFPEPARRHVSAGAQP